MGTEFIFGNTFGFDMKGFANEQIMGINKYKKLLVELGEKSYISTKSNLPVEIRIAGLILFNTAIFIFTKMFVKATGMNINNSQPKPIEQNNTQKMKGPSISAKDIEDLN